MNEDEKMFQWGLGLAMLVFMLTAVLQVCYRVQDKTRASVRAEIVKTQQEIADKDARFASFVRMEILRNLVYGIYPKAEVISFNKTISIDELQAKE